MPGCLRFGEKVRLAVGILTRFGTRAGQHRYRAAYDVNGDGVIDANDLLDVLAAPLCPTRAHGNGRGR